LALASVKNWHQQKLLILPTSELNTLGSGFKEQYNYKTADQLELCLNFEIILDLTRDILNYYAIHKVFSHKWANKYCILGVLKKFYESSINCPASIKSREAQLIQMVDISYFQKFTVSWYMSSQRIMCLSMREFQPISRIELPYDELTNEGLVK
jgi:hypothetical protein